MARVQRFVVEAETREGIGPHVGDEDVGRSTMR